MAIRIKDLQRENLIDNASALAIDTSKGTRNISVEDLTNHIIKKIIQNTPNTLGMFFYGIPQNTDGWLLCDGSTYKRADYPELTALWDVTFRGVTWYLNKDSSTFNVPNMLESGLSLRAPSSTYGYMNGDILKYSTALPHNPLKVNVAEHNHSVKISDHSHKIVSSGSSNFDLQYKHLASGRAQSSSSYNYALSSTNKGPNVCDTSLDGGGTYNTSSQGLEAEVSGGDAETRVSALIVPVYVKAKNEINL